MSDFSDPTKSQEKPKSTEEKTTEPAKKDAVEAPFEQEDSVDEVVPQDILSEEPLAAADDSSEKVTDSSPSSSEHIEPQDNVESDNISDSSHTNNEIDKADEALVSEASDDAEPPASEIEAPDTSTEDNDTDKADEAPVSEASDDTEPPVSETETSDISIEDNEIDKADEAPVSEASDDTESPASEIEASDMNTEDDDTGDTDDELIVAAAASKVSSRFGGTRVETIRPEQDSGLSEETTASHDTISAEVPLQEKEKKKKKEKKPKEPLPDVAPESKILNSFSLLPCLTLIIFAALQGGIALFSRDLWPLQETQAAAVVKDTLAASNWLTPMLDGKPYSGAMPFYFWFSSAVALIPDIAITFAVKASTLLSSMLFVLSTYLFARAAGISKKTSLTAGLLTIAAFLPAVTMQLNGMETLFAALVTFAHAAFVMGWRRERSFFWLIIGFICAAAATLTGGFPGLFLPLFSILFITCWRKRPTRFGEWDVAGGFGIYLSIVLSWFAYVYFAVQPDYLLNLVPNVLAAPFKGALAHLPYWWHMLAMLPFILLPWLVVFLVLPWTRVLSVSFYKDVLATRNPENIGIAYLWLSAILTCALYCALDYMSPVWLLVLLPQIAILAARAIKNFSPLRSKVFYRLLAAVFFGFGVALICLVNFTEIIPFEIQGWIYMAAILLAAAGIFWFRFPLNSRCGVIGMAVVMTLLMQPLFIMSAPAINSFISTKDISLTMEEYAAKDFTPVVYNADPAPFAYFVSEPVIHIIDPHSLTTILNSKRNVVVIMSATEWNNWLTKPESLELVGTQKTAIPHIGQGFILAVQQKNTSRYSNPLPADGQPESVTPDTQDPAQDSTADEPTTAPSSKEKPVMDGPQTDNEEEPAPLQEPLNDHSTTATSADSTAKQEAAMATQVAPELAVPEN
ncbi:hypothetical protein [Halodesulfovibrio sp. MK-HDV]|jgi:4-amino-4-deoxy-L-arabinose transferase-like glycosyltransferase|uniref:hypothetical protein n=1 Tax=Halodesulfovibrio sp. MK-HDV TaxID=2599925 RepID=UPI00136A8E0E|nr:hypothetical protein [Halodesulfovibrio sp. MK-HDV]KAF1075095.1 hypothetical protein MKHDV_02138 [Halodesulfovibrio sp. MK-HDV]